MVKNVCMVVLRRTAGFSSGSLPKVACYSEGRQERIKKSSFFYLEWHHPGHQVVEIKVHCFSEATVRCSQLHVWVLEEPAWRRKEKKYQCQGLWVPLGRRMSSAKEAASYSSRTSLENRSGKG